MSHASSAQSHPVITVERPAATPRLVRYVVTGAAGAAIFSLPAALAGPDAAVYCEALYEKLAARTAVPVTPAEQKSASPRLALLR